MAKASPYVFEAGSARWSPPEQQPTVGDTGPSIALPAPCEAAKQVIQAAAERVLLHDRPYAEMLAAERRKLELLDTGTSVLEWAVGAFLLFAALVLVWVAIFYWRRGTKIEKA